MNTTITNARRKSWRVLGTRQLVHTTGIPPQVRTSGFSGALYRLEIFATHPNTPLVRICIILLLYYKRTSKNIGESIVGKTRKGPPSTTTNTCGARPLVTPSAAHVVVTMLLGSLRPYGRLFYFYFIIFAILIGCFCRKNVLQSMLQLGPSWASIGSVSPR